MHDLSKDLADKENVQWFVCRQARISARRGPTWGGPKVTSTKNRKLLGSGLLFFYERCNFIFVFSNYFISFRYSRQGTGTFPLAASVQLGVSIPGKFTTE